MQTKTTGTALVLIGTTVELTDLVLTVVAEDYASALDLADARFRMSGGSLRVAARDGVAISVENTDAGFSNTEIAVNSSFVARGMEVRGRFPQVMNCRLSFTGAARRSDVFSAYTGGGEGRSGVLRPVNGSIGDNSFEGFTHILGDEFPSENIQGFNRLFAPGGRPNSRK
jgi:hypothetical protein